MNPFPTAGSLNDNEVKEESKAQNERQRWDKSDRIKFWGRSTRNSREKGCFEQLEL